MGLYLSTEEEEIVERQCKHCALWDVSKGCTAPQTNPSIDFKPIEYCPAYMKKKPQEDPPNFLDQITSIQKDCQFLYNEFSNLKQLTKILQISGIRISVIYLDEKLKEFQEINQRLSKFNKTCLGKDNLNNEENPP